MAQAVAAPGSATDHLNINPRILNAARLAKIKLTDFDKILGASLSELERETKLKTADVKTLQLAVAATAYDVSRVTTALDCSKTPIPQLTTGCKVLDTFLRGGVPARGITEIAGESGSGKTQLCLQMALHAQLPAGQGGFDSGVVYICTESGFPDKRLQQMIRARPRIFKQQFSDRIFIQHVAEQDDLLACVQGQLPKLLSARLAKLVVIDSVAALFRTDGPAETFERSRKLIKLSGALHSLGNKFGVAVVCINQVTTAMDGPPGNRVIPALGLSWANGVTTRVMLHRTSQEVSLQQEDDAGKVVNRLNVIVRKMRVCFAPHIPTDGVCKFIIDPEGVKGVGME